MADWQFNRLIKGAQWRRLQWVLVAVLALVALLSVVMAQGGSNAPSKKETPADLTGLVDETFTEQVAQNAMLTQQQTLEGLKNELATLSKTLTEMKAGQQTQLQQQGESLRAEFSEQLLQALAVKPAPTEQPTAIKNDTLWHQEAMATRPATIHTVSFRKPAQRPLNHLNPDRYVPSNTSVRAVILGGVDADASVDSQMKNNGAMLFKFLEDGTLPNGQRSHLRGCRVSAHAYGDISSERAFATLYRLSCAHRGQPIIDKKISGWVFFNGKVGIKGQPLMRDNKVMTWAGISGALSGVAQAAQYAQSVQQFGAYGAASTVPSGNIAPYAAYGGAAKAADTLSQYYVKRAEQYHPVIQVGAGNVVTVVFKDGFYLTPEGDNHASNEAEHQPTLRHQNAASEDSLNFTVPNEVLNEIDRVAAKGTQGGLQ